MKRRVGVEQQRLERVIDYKSNKTPSERPRKTEGSSKTRKLPSPDEAGVYSPGTPSETSLLIHSLPTSCQKNKERMGRSTDNSEKDKGSSYFCFFPPQKLYV
jgi:hypothetical protein